MSTSRTDSSVRLLLKKHYKKGHVEVIRVVKNASIYDIFYLDRHMGQFKGEDFLRYKGRQNEFYKHYKSSNRSTLDIVVFKKIGSKIFLKNIQFHSSFQKLFTFKKEILTEKFKDFD